MKKLFRYSSAAIVFILVLSLFSTPILSNSNNVLAQEDSPTQSAEPPVVETPTGEPTLSPTEEPTAAPTLQPTALPTASITPETTSIPEEVNPEGAGFNWSIQVKGQTQEPTADAMLALNLLRSQGVLSELAGSVLNLSGSRDIAQMRQAMYEGFPEGFDFLGGPVSLLITYPAEAGVEIIIRLETRTTTGYSWVLEPSSEFNFSQIGQAEYQPRSEGMGVPSIQTLRFTPNFSGTGTLHLVYQRVFEPDAPIFAEIQLHLIDQPAELDLSDPLPTAISEKVISPPGEEPSRAFDDIPFRGVAFPSSFDWRSYGVVPSVRNQGGCGSCWAFGTVGIMESAIRIGGGGLTNLSEQFLVQCNREEWGCNGGLTAHKYHLNVEAINQYEVGAVYEYDMPYTGQTWGTGCQMVSDHPYKLTGWEFITGSEWTVPTVDQIKSAIYTYGPVTAGVCAGPGWNTYSGGVYSTDEPEATCGGFTNHQIIIVGWDDATQTWILRNSWGPSWGDGGYMHISWNTSRVGEGTSWVKYGVSPITPSTPTLVSPVSGFVTKEPDITLSWSMVIFGTGYDVQVDNNSDFSSPASTGTSLSETSFQPVDLPDGKYYWRVRAKNLLDQASPWSAARYFTIDTTPPAPPLLSKPLNGSQFTGTPTFTWLASAGAKYYQVRYDDVVDPDPEAYDYRSPANITLLTHKPTTAPPLMIPTFWQVRAADAAGNWSDWSAPFTVTVVPPVPPAPVLTAPVSGSLINTRTPTLAWNTVAYASTYDIQIDTTYTFAVPLIQTHADIAELNHVIDSLPDGRYYWRVRARNAKNVAGAWSAYRYFTIDATKPNIPVLSKPINTGESIGTPTFTWLASAGAKYYQVQYEAVDDSDPETYDYRSPANITLLTHKPNTTLPLMSEIHWQVRAGDAAGNWSEWSEPPFSVTIIPAVPLAPILNNPVSGFATQNKTPELSWNTVAYADKWEIQVDTTSTFTASLVQEVTTLNYIVDPPLDDGKYYWRVRALNINPEAVPGAWSAARYFTIDNIKPEPPLLSKPLNGSQFTGTPTFAWLASVGAKYYQVQYDDVDDGTETYDYLSPANITLLTHKPTVIPPGMIPVYWQVRAADAAGNWSNWSAPFSVTVVPPVPAAPVLTAPVSGLLINTSTPTLAWKTVAYASTYDIQIDTTYTFAVPLIQTHPDIAELNHVIDSLPDGKYYWRVRARNAKNAVSAWSAYRYFTIDATKPNIPVLSKPLNDGQSIGTPTFTWLASAGAKYYQVQYDDVDDSDPETYDYRSPANITLLTHKPNTTLPLMSEIHWQVRAGDLAGNWSDWSAPFRVTVVPPLPVAPVVTAPVSGLLTNTPPLTFTWNTVAYAVNYEIQIDELATFTDPLILEDNDITTLNYVVDSLPDDGKYYWRVRAFNINAAAGAWSAARYFTIDTVKPEPPVYTGPLAGSESIGSPTFTWLASAGAKYYQVQYEEDYPDTDDETYAYRSPVLTTLTHKPAVIPSLPIPIYWQVRAGDAAGNWSEWGSFWNVTVVPPPPGKPTLITPVTNSTLEGTYLRVSWNPVDYAVWYYVEVGYDPYFESPRAYFSEPYSNQISIGPLSYRKYYYVRVIAININGDIGPWSTTSVFTWNPAFNSQFNTDGYYDGWSDPVEWNVTGGNYTFTPNYNPEDWGQGVYYYPGTDINFNDFRYRAKILMPSKVADPYGLINREYALVATAGSYKAYYFVVAQVRDEVLGDLGCYMVYYQSYSTYTPLTPEGKYWCSPDIHYDDWNILEVRAVGSTLEFFINSQLFWRQTNTSYGSGGLGISTRNRIHNDLSPLYVDWAVAGLPPLATSTNTKTLSQNQFPLPAGISVELPGEFNLIE